MTVKGSLLGSLLGVLVAANVLVTLPLWWFAIAMGSGPAIASVVIAALVGLVAFILIAQRRLDSHRGGRVAH